MSARFFCDNCGTEVKRNAVRCTKCGRYFAFVRCPQCGFTGEEGLFSKGCPVCGYCTTEQNNVPPVQPPPMTAAGKLPLWVYIVVVLGLAVVALVLYLIVR